MVKLAVVIYFSRSGQNKQSGQLQYINIGNTAILAKKIGQQSGAQSMELQVAEPYDAEYHATLIRSRQEASSCRPVPIKALDGNITTEKQVFLGFPIWWGTVPPAVITFLSINDLSKASIYPFCTHEGSQFGRSIAVIKALVPAAKVNPGLAVRGSKVYRADQAVANWLECLEFRMGE